MTKIASKKLLCPHNLQVTSQECLSIAPRRLKGVMHSRTQHQTEVTASRFTNIPSVQWICMNGARLVLRPGVLLLDSANFLASRSVRHTFIRVVYEKCYDSNVLGKMNCAARLQIQKTNISRVRCVIQLFSMPFSSVYGYVCTQEEIILFRQQRCNVQRDNTGHPATLQVTS